MKKVLSISGVVVVVLVVAVILIIGFKLGDVIKVGVENVGPTFTRGAVSLEKAFVRPVSGKARLNNLVVSNPAGYKTPSAFELGEVYVKLDPRSLTSDTVVIEEIRIVGPVITYEKSLKKSNIAQILANVEKIAGASGEDSEDDKEKEEPTGKKVVINYVVVEGAKVRLSTALLMGKAVPLPLPKVELRDIGKEKGGTSFAEAVKLIIGAVLKAVTKVVAVAGEMAVDAGKAVGKAALKAGEVAVDGAVAVGEAAVEGAADGVKAVGGTAVKGVKAVGGAAAGGAKALTRGIGGLIGADRDEEKSKTQEDATDK